MAQHPLIALANDREVKALSLFTDACRRISQDDLVDAYNLELAHAPQRPAVNRPYLMPTHDGIPSTGTSTNRDEEHLALALFNQFRPPKPGLILPNGERLYLLDYQLPLKATQGDAGIGKVDLFAVTSYGRPTIIELKVAGGDTPLRALLEGLAYAAIVQANMPTIRREIQERYTLATTANVPQIIVMGPEQYWNLFRSNPAAKDWQAGLRRVAAKIERGLGVAVTFIELRNASFVHGVAGTKPRLASALTCHVAVDQNE